MRGIAFAIPLAATACGRWGFEANDGGTGGGDGAPPGTPVALTVSVVGSGRVTSTPAGVDCPDRCTVTVPASMPVALAIAHGTDAWFAGWSGGCGGRDATCTLTPTGDVTVGAELRALPNRAFVLDAFTNGAFGGVGPADQLCANAASAAGLAGVFVALLSTSTLDARDRLAGSRGWIRTDGAPVADTAAALFAGAMFNPIDRAANGMPVSGSVWTGTNADGRKSPDHCNDWTNATAQQFGAHGVIGYAWPAFASSGAGGCANTNGRLLCMEIGRDVSVGPAAESGRLAFVSRAAMPSAGYVGTSGLDAICQGEAQAAGHTATFLAAVATTTASIAARFPVDARPWVRPDGTRIADAAALLTMQDRASFVNQHADGGYTSYVWVFTGSADPTVPGTMVETCNDWTSASGTQVAPNGDPGGTDGRRAWGMQGASCNSGNFLLCLER